MGYREEQEILNQEVKVDYHNIKSGKLVLTDEIFRTLLIKEGSV